MDGLGLNPGGQSRQRVARNVPLFAITPRHHAVRPGRGRQKPRICLSPPCSARRIHQPGVRTLWQATATTLTLSGFFQQPRHDSGKWMWSISTGQSATVRSSSAKLTKIDHRQPCGLLARPLRTGLRCMSSRRCPNSSRTLQPMDVGHARTLPRSGRGTHYMAEGPTTQTACRGYHFPFTVSRIPYPEFPSPELPFPVAAARAPPPLPPTLCRLNRILKNR